LPYEYDVFLSYTVSSSNGAWVREHFRSLLVDRLENAMPRSPRLFDFDEQETGMAWPDNLARALRGSRLLVAVLSPPYFRSAWCLAEWNSMLARERLLGLSSEDDPKGLIYPIVYADGIHFPDSAKRRFNKHDFSAWNYPNRHFRETEAFLDFTNAVANVAEEIAGRLDDVPPWRDDFPIVRPGHVMEFSSQLERLI
jgi:TIR domain